MKIDIFDLHCDFLSKCVDSGIHTFEQYLAYKKNNKNFFEFEFDTVNNKNHNQILAVFIDDKLLKDGIAQENFNQQAALFKDILKNKHKLINQDRNLNLILSLENAGVLSNVEDINLCKQIGIRLATLTWNGENSLGFSHLNNKGLKPFGKLCVKEFENNNIIIDVSHLSENGFYDVCKISTKPIIASHSNCKTICSNSRNLTDEQIKIIIQKHGLVGICFHKLFIADNVLEKDDLYLDYLIKHIDNILSLGGKQVISIGSDFDGATPPQCLKNTLYIENLINKMLKLGYSDDLINDLMYNNANNFFIENFD